MTDRDTFAAAALTGMMSRVAGKAESFAEAAYKLADAMLRERLRTSATHESHGDMGMRSRDPLISYAFAVMLITVGFCVVAVLGDINKSIQEVSQAIRLQTAQQSWLVEHYAKPVRHILPWKEDK